MSGPLMTPANIRSCLRDESRLTPLNGKYQVNVHDFTHLIISGYVNFNFFHHLHGSRRELKLTNKKCQKFETTSVFLHADSVFFLSTMNQIKLIPCKI